MKPKHPYIDFTFPDLDEKAPLEKYRELCKTAVSNADIVRAVCVPPTESIVKLCIEETKDSNVLVCCVNDFPFGNGGEKKKKEELVLVYELGVRVFDTVINLTALRHGLYNVVHREIETLSMMGSGITIKAILETGHEWYNETLIKLVSKLAYDAGAWCLKTSTGRKNIDTPAGFLPEISLEDKIQHAAWMHEAAPRAMIKVAGGIGNLQDVKDICAKIPAEKVLIGASEKIWLFGMPD